MLKWLFPPAHRLMHLHILGICGTFMGGIAALARAAGHRVTGSDANVYPPMSTQLEAQGIALIEGYDPAQLDLKPDVVVVGNVMSRGNALIERLLDSGMPFTSGPQWLAENVLRGREVCGGRGHARQDHDHLDARLDPARRAGRDPGFLIGGIPSNFGVSARAGGGAAFVIEADEYDTAFFDKRAKFVHYRPRHLLLTNLEFDHADIYPDLASIEKPVPSPACAPCRARAASPGTRRTRTSRRRSRWAAGRRSRVRARAARGRRMERAARGGRRLARSKCCAAASRSASLRWPLIGMHNVENGLAAIACAAGMGVAPAGRGRGPRRIRGRAPAHGAARRGAAASASTTTSRTIRRRSR